MSVPGCKGGPVYTNQPPAEWPELLELSQEPARGRHHPGRFANSLSPLSEAAVQMDRMQIDSNLFYSLGMGACKLAQLLQDPEIRDEIIEDGINLVLSDWTADRAAERPFGILLPVDNEGARPLLNEVFQPHIDAAYLSLPEDIRILGNFLSMIGVERDHGRSGSEEEARRTKHRTPITWMLESPITDTASPAPMLYQLRGAVGVQPAALIGRIIKDRGTQSYRKQIPDRVVRDYLRDASVTRTALQLGGTHVNHLMSSLEHVDSTDEGVVVRGVLPKHSKDVEGHGYLVRKDAIGCPARFARAVQPVMDIAIEIVRQTSLKLENG